MDIREAAAETGGLTYNDLLRTGPGTLAGRYLRSFWQPVYRSEDLPLGKAKPIRIMSEDFTLYRGVSGKAQVVAARCPHRGARLVLGWVEGDDIRCAYHGWKYAASGQCIEQPAEPRPFCETVALRSYPTVEYLGLVFAYLGEGEAPPPLRLPEYEAEGYLRELRMMVWPANYFAQLENALDVVHTKFLHWQFNYKIPDDLVAAETEYGLTISTPGLSGAEAFYDTGIFLMPNAHEWVGPPRPGQPSRYMGLGWRVPQDDESHIRFDVSVFPLKGREGLDYKAKRDAENNHAGRRPTTEVVWDMLAGRDDFAALKARPEVKGSELTSIQDCAVMTSLGPMASREHSERLGRTDVGVALLRRIWTRELRAFADGKPLTPWKRPDIFWNVLS